MNTQFDLTDPTRRDKWKKKRLIKSVGIPVAVGIFAFSIGAGTVAEAEPVTIEKEVPVEVEKIVTETVEITPNACATALDLAEKGFELYGDGFMIASDMLGEFNAETLQSLTDDMNSLRENDLAPVLAAYRMNAEECRGAGA